MYRKTKFNIRLLLCVAACTMCWTIALADSTDTNTAVKVNSSSYQDWADRTDISAKFQTNHKPIYSIETLQPIGHYDNNSKSVVFVQGKVGSLSNVGVFTLRVFFGTNHMYGWCHSFCSKVEYVL